MKEYFVHIKGIKGKIVAWIFFVLVFTAFYTFLYQQIKLASLGYAFSLVTTIVSLNKLIFYYSDEGSAIANRASANSYFPFLVLLPTKKSSIVIWDFLHGAAVIIMYIAGFNIVFEILKWLFGISQQYNIYPLFISPLATTLFLFSFYCLMMAVISLIHNRTFTLILATITNVLLFIPFYVPLFLTAEDKKVASFLTNLYNDSMISIPFLFISILMFLISLLVNLKVIYRREF
ncbi:hypothetical protein Calhy_0119 [Caldicellulosiruptor hydrothermalis 108]|uniref:Uncharacterized protein n=1 Tax=Caldicellulosiruptor hydrothermalis (strain DSM 18901 / VKM B-2411 / 108) TaxID=632292 RepID=E4QA05_CALH1|nr:hypothetical protein [Caldicellulosiruptor hydrothermalis]ADQ05880.1 hypothetical protein Calhy_0119 [Caldicellulosiruptor hydrothermalis 108]